MVTYSCIEFMLILWEIRHPAPPGRGFPYRWCQVQKSRVSRGPPSLAYHPPIISCQGSREGGREGGIEGERGSGGRKWRGIRE